MENVLSVDYDKNRFPGNYITQEEADKHNLRLPENDSVYDDLWVTRFINQN